MTDSKVSKQVGVRLPLAMHAELVALAKKERRAVGFIVRDFIEAGLKRESKAKPAKRS